MKISCLSLIQIRPDIANHDMVFVNINIKPKENKQLRGQFPYIEKQGVKIFQ